MNPPGPREHHYQFSHTFLCQQVMATPDPLFQNLSSPKASMFLQFLWSELGEQVNTPDGAGGLSLSVLGADVNAGWQVVLVQMPPAHAPGESIAVVLARNAAQVRYFVLDQSTSPGMATMAEYAAVGRIALGQIQAAPGAFLQAVGGTLGFAVSPAAASAVAHAPKKSSSTWIWVAAAVAVIGLLAVGSFAYRITNMTSSAPPRPSSSAAPREPVGPSVYVATRGGSYSLVRFSEKEAAIAEQLLSVRSVLATKKGGVFYIAAKPSVSLGTKRVGGTLMEEYIPGGKPHLYYYDGVRQKRGKLPLLDAELLHELDNGWLVAKGRETLGLFDGKSWLTQKACELTKSSKNFGGNIEDIRVLRDGRIALAVDDQDGKGFLVEAKMGADVKSVAWSRTPIPAFPATERFKRMASASLLELDDGLYLRINHLLYKRKGDGFERIVTPVRLAYRPMVQSGGALISAAGAGTRERTSLYRLEGKRFKLLKRYPKDERITTLHQGADGRAYVIIKRSKKGNFIQVVEPDGTLKMLLKDGETIGFDNKIAIDPRGRIWTWGLGKGGHVIVDGKLREHNQRFGQIAFSGDGPEKVPENLDETLSALLKR